MIRQLFAPLLLDVVFVVPANVHLTLPACDLAVRCEVRWL